MTIIIANSTAQPSLTFNHLHVSQFGYTHAQPQNSPRVLDAVVTPYAVDSNSNIVMAPAQTVRAHSNDFDSLAIQAWLAANPGKTIADAVLAYAAARAKVQAQYAAGSLDVLTLMAYFEIAVGDAVQMTSPVVLSGIS